MRYNNSHHNENGFTLLELIVVILFAGILAAISAPSFSALNQRNKVTQDLTSAKNALMEAQIGAMRRGQSCALSFSTGTPPTISSSSGNCLLTGTRTLYNVSMTVYQDGTSGAITSHTLTFDYLGNNATATTTIVLQYNNNIGDKKCIVVSQPLGLIATGKYTGTSSTNISSNCTP